jgi:oligoribonuclease NrnB/cAMP/cGMP phosphodiesterase (DHH superfamily)
MTKLTPSLAECNQINFHGGCPDGIISRNILVTALEFLGVTGLDLVPRRPGVKNSTIHPAVFVDMSPATEEEFLEVLQKGGFILDHHASNKWMFDKYEAEFSAQLLWGENDRAQSGAWLAWTAVSSLLYPYDLEGTSDLCEKIKNAAHLASVYDTWHTEHSSFELAQAFANLVMLIGNDYDGFYEEKDLALMLWASKKKAVARSAEKAIWRDILGKRVAFINSLKTSNVSELLRQQGANLIVGHAEMFDSERGQEWLGFSMRSDGSFDCSIFALAHGGGGHKPAAGFGMPLADLHKSPQGNVYDWFTNELQVMGWQ